MSELQEITVAASHEFIEAATDPLPWNGLTASDTSSYTIEDYSSPWTMLPGEVGDHCVQEMYTESSGYMVQRVWSNTAAAASPGLDPCVPEAQGTFFNVSTDLQTTQFVPKGQSVTYQVHAWSNAPTAKWYVSPALYQATFQPTWTLVTADGQSVNNNTP